MIRHRGPWDLGSPYPTPPPATATRGRATIHHLASPQSLPPTHPLTHSPTIQNRSPDGSHHGSDTGDNNWGIESEGQESDMWGWYDEGGGSTSEGEGAFGELTVSER